MSETAARKVSSGPDLQELFASTDRFAKRHLGSGPDEIAGMLETLGYPTLDALIDTAVPASIRLNRPLDLPTARGEGGTLHELREIFKQNKVFRSFIGMGYQECITPPVLQRNILENPGWYTAYTPYQAEIAQGRLEMLLNFQTMVIDLTGLEVANASLLDEGTAAAEAVAMAYVVRKDKEARAVFVSSRCHPQSIDVVRTRAVPLGLEVITGLEEEFDFSRPVFATLLQYPATDGALRDPSAFVAQTHGHNALSIMACDIMSLVLLKPPGEWGADIAVGSTQRFGIPLGYGGPHAAYLATSDALKRHMPGRIVGVSRDSHGRPAYRLALQTREQHIRRERATSNICTAQVLLAVIAAAYAAYHGPEGLRAIALRIHRIARCAAATLKGLGYEVAEPFFDTLRVHTGGTPAREIMARAESREINLRLLDEHHVGIALDEATHDLDALLEVFSEGAPVELDLGEAGAAVPRGWARTSDFLTHPVFNSYHTETEMLRYLHRLEARDLSLTTSMIPLGSCTMKLNATAEMLPVTWFGVARMHPFAPLEQARGYATLTQQLSRWLAEITGFAAISLQPNAGSQGEFAGLLAIREYHRNRGEEHRTICLIPTSAHGTNPASAVMAGMKVVPIKCRENGDIDLDDLRSKADAHASDLAALMITYPSTHGVFEQSIRQVCEIIHGHGGQVYMDGANLNAQVGLCRPGDFGADVCHLNLHKTFCIPHGGGGPGVGPIGVAEHLKPFLPDHPVIHVGEGIGAIAAAPWGSASILVIPWAYIRMMGPGGVTEATRLAILNANYIARRLRDYFPVLYKGEAGLVAHECILDLRAWEKSIGLKVEDVAKRLMDYGFHAPTISWPVPGTMMIEPTESESLEELDRFCEAMITIRGEMDAIESGAADPLDNPLKNAPHTARAVTADEWPHAYSREAAAFPAPWLREHKFWPAVGRIDNVYGDRNPVCSCPPVEDYNA